MENVAPVVQGQPMLPQIDSRLILQIRHPHALQAAADYLYVFGAVEVRRRLRFQDVTRDDVVVARIATRIGTAVYVVRDVLRQGNMAHRSSALPYIYLDNIPGVIEQARQRNFVVVRHEQIEGHDIVVLRDPYQFEWRVAPFILLDDW